MTLRLGDAEYTLNTAWNLALIRTLSLTMHLFNGNSNLGVQVGATVVRRLYTLFCR